MQTQTYISKLTHMQTAYGSFHTMRSENGKMFSHEESWPFKNTRLAVQMETVQPDSSPLGP